MIEFECTLNCNFKCDYCTNGRNSVLQNKIPEVDDLSKLDEFLLNNDDFYIYGGEPLLAKNIIHIVSFLKLHNKKYVIQTNFSLENTIRDIVRIDPDVKFQVSIHTTQIDYKEYIPRLILYDNNITQIDVMFTSIHDLTIYRDIQSYIKSSKSNKLSKLRLIPVADFATDRVKYRCSLYLYNMLRRSNLDNIIFDDDNRSFIWEKQMRGQITPFGKQCIGITKNYIMYDPMLNKHKCPQRYDGDTCIFKTCFNLENV